MDNQKRIIKEMNIDSTYTFQSVMENYNIKGEEAFDILNFLIKEGIIQENGDCFKVIVDNETLCALKEKNKGSETKESGEDDSNLESLFDRIKDVLGSKLEEENTDNEEDNFSDDSEESEEDFEHVDDDYENEEDFDVNDIPLLQKKKGYAPLPDGKTIFLLVSGERPDNYVLRINIKHSIKDFLGYLLETNSDAMRKLFKSDTDYMMYLSGEGKIDLKNSEFMYKHFIYSSKPLKWNKTIMKQRKAYNDIMFKMNEGSFMLIEISLCCK